MRYRTCQYKWLCPDKFGHFFGFFAIAWPIIIWLGMAKGFIIITLSLLWEVYESWQEGWKVIDWFMLPDTQKDIVVDFFAVIFAVFLYPHWSWFWWLVSILIAIFFGRFTSWRELRDRWWDFRLWKYFPWIDL